MKILFRTKYAFCQKNNPKNIENTPPETDINFLQNIIKRQQDYRKFVA
jgi:hypothetical protein